MRKLRPILMAAMLGLGLGGSPMAMAQGGRAAQANEAEAPQAKVSVRIMEVYATESHSKVDARLSKLSRYLSHLKFTGYELLDTHSVTLGPNNSQSFSIAGERKMEITILDKDDRKVRMRVQVTSNRGGKLLDTTLSVNRNGTFIVAGPKYKDGVLVLPLTAQY